MFIPVATRELRRAAVTEGVVEAVREVEAADLFQWHGGRMWGRRATPDLRMQRM